MIRIAEISDLESVLRITRDTISEIYFHYYAEGVVNFFLEHHSRENVLSDIENGLVWLLEEDGCMVGTVTIKGKFEQARPKTHSDNAKISEKWYID